MKALRLLSFIVLSIASIPVFCQTNQWLKVSGETHTVSILLDGDSMYTGHTRDGIGITDLTTGKTTTFDQVTGGLENDEIKNLIKDKHRQIWACAKHSISTLQNGQWQNYLPVYFGLPEETEFNELAEDQTGNKWIACNQGLIKWSLDNSYTVYDSTIFPALRNGLNSVSLQGAIVWCTSNSSIVKYDGTSWTEINQQNSNMQHSWVEKIVIDKNNNVWVNNTGHLAVITSGNQLSYYPSPSYLAGPCHLLTTDTAGNLWMTIHKIVFPGKTVYDLAHYDGGNWIYETVHIISATALNVVSATNKYIGMQYGVYQLLEDTGAYWPTIPEQIGNSQIVDIKMCRKSNTIWLGSGEYINKFSDSGEWTIFENPQPPPVNYDLFARYGFGRIYLDHDDTLWQSGNHEITKLIEQGDSFIEQSIPLPNYYTKIAFDTLNNIWRAPYKIGYSSGPTTFVEEDSVEYFANNYQDMQTNGPNGLNDFIVDENTNTLWLTTNKSLYTYNNGTWSTFFTDSTYNPGASFSTDTSGYTYYASKYQSCVLVNNGYNPIAENPIDLKLSKLVIDHDGSLWAVSCNKYLLHYVNNTWDTLFWHKHQYESADNFITELVIDHYGNKWMLMKGTNTYVMVYNEAGIKGPLKKSVPIPPGNTPQLGFSLFPNPGNGKFTLSLPEGIEGDLYIEVYDMTGKQVKLEKIRGELYMDIQLNYTDLQKGVYFIKITTSVGVLKGRFIKA